MQELRNGNTLTSNEVAGMMKMEHNELLKKITKISIDLGGGNFPLTDFWVESAYKTKQNKIVKCYSITKKGCEFLANKTTGSKGNIFTALYVNKFNDMEQEQNKPLSLEEMTLKVIEGQRDRILQLETRNNDLTGVLSTIQTYGDNLLFREYVKVIYSENGIKINEKEFRKMLIDQGYLMKDLYPFAKHKQYFNVNKGVNNGKAWTTTRLSARGQLYFTKKLLNMFDNLN
jgi:phage regulator Rha-like protein